MLLKHLVECPDGSYITPARSRSAKSIRADASPAPAVGCVCDDTPTGVAEQLRATLDVASISVTVVDEDFEHVWSNQATENFVGVPIETIAEEVLRPKAGPGWLFFDRYGERYDFMAEMGRCLETRSRMALTVLGTRRPDGTMLWSDVEVIPVPACLCGTRWHAVILGTDLTEQHFAEEVLHRLAFSDPLTGLANRAVLEDRLEQAIFRAERSGMHAALLFIDLDRFKQINDEFGHEAGDRVLRVVAKRLSSVFRPEDTVARIGGDEFVVLTADLSTGSAPVERVREAVEKPVTITVDGADRQVSTAVSIGWAQSDESVTPPELLAAADAAMYEDKRRRKARWSSANRG